MLVMQFAIDSALGTIVQLTDKAGLYCDMHVELSYSGSSTQKYVTWDRHLDWGDMLSTSI